MCVRKGKQSARWSGLISQIFSSQSLKWRHEAGSCGSMPHSQQNACVRSPQSTAWETPVSDEKGAEAIPTLPAPGPPAIPDVENARAPRGRTDAFSLCFRAISSTRFVCALTPTSASAAAAAAADPTPPAPTPTPGPLLAGRDRAEPTRPERSAALR